VASIAAIFTCGLFETSDPKKDNGEGDDREPAATEKGELGVRSAWPTAARNQSSRTVSMSEEEKGCDAPGVREKTEMYQGEGVF